MADITNNDILNAIIGRYQNNPNRVSDAVLQQKVDALKAELENVKSELQNMNTKLAGTLETELKGADIFTDTNPGSVQLTGSSVPDTQPIPHKKISKFVLETLINAESVEAGGNTTSKVITSDGSESEIWVLVNCDKQPWSLKSGQPWNKAATYGGTANFYPERKSVATAYGNIMNPAISLCLGLNFATFLGLTQPTTMQEARNLVVPVYNGVQLRVGNESAETATITVRLLRIWR